MKILFRGYLFPGLCSAKANICSHTKTPPHRVSRLWLSQALRGSLSAVSPCGNIKTPPKKSSRTEAQRASFCGGQNRQSVHGKMRYSSKNGVFRTFWHKMEKKPFFFIPQKAVFFQLFGAKWSYKKLQM